MTWTPENHMGNLDRIVSSLSLSSPNHCGHLRNEPVDGRDLSTFFCHSTFHINSKHKKSVCVCMCVCVKVF